MSDRLSAAALRFVADVEGFDQSTDILEAVHKVARLAELNVFGAWLVPSPHILAWIHPSVPPAFLPEFRELYLKHGRSFLAQLAWRNRGAFTMTEALRIMKPTGNDRWLLELLHKYHMRDLFYIPNGDIMMVYWAAKLLRLDVPTKAALRLAANAAAARLDGLSRDKGGLEPDPGLSTRQRAVLRLLAEGYTPYEIAERLEISHGTVKEHLERASRKLGAKSAAHAVAEAIRRYVVIGLGVSVACGVILEFYDICCWDEIVRSVV